MRSLPASWPIGANYAGVRAMTSTSGPGISLMQEAIGLSGITETPLVVVDVMRGGPGTGLPTKTEQSDLNELLYGSHGEIPRIVLTPTSVEECFRYTAEAFNLAEKYQCPVIVATDMFLGMSKQSVPVKAIDFSRFASIAGVDFRRRAGPVGPGGISPLYRDRVGDFQALDSGSEERTLSSH